MEDMTALRDALLEDMEADGVVLVDHEGFVARLDALIASAEQRGRDQWLHATAHGTRQWEGLLAKYDLAEDADASSVIAAVEARAALTPERLAKALDAVPWEPVRDPLDMVTYQEAAAQLLAALTTDEAVP